MGIKFNQSVSFAAQQRLFDRLNKDLTKVNTQTIPVREADKVTYPKVTAEQAIVYFTGTKRVSLPGLVSQIDPANLKAHVNYLASDELAGRKPGTEGIQKAQDYIVDNFKKAGLQPFTPLANEDYVNKVVYQMVYHECTEDKTTGKFHKDDSVNAFQMDGRKIALNNLMAVLPAKNKSDEYVFITAHYDHLGRNVDTNKVYTGADDNASGISALLEMSRILSKTRPDKNIVFVATSGEEMGTLGASLLAKQMKMTGLKGKVEVLNMDCLAADGDFMTIEGGAPKAHKHLQQTAMRVANQLGIKYETPPRNDRTDAEAFEKAGFPAITFLWAWMNDMSNRSHYHDPTDRPEKANYQNLYESTKLALGTAWELAKTSV